MNPGDRFRAWAHNRAKSPLCHTPNRCGLYVIEQNEQFADLAMRSAPVLPELVAYLRGIGAESFSQPGAGND